jgi:probable F420-dependent oxidoreductase
MSDVRVSVMPPVRGGVCADPDWMVEIARHAERLGFDEIVTVEHPLVIGTYSSRYPYAESGRMPLPNDCAVPDPLDTLAFVAGATSTLGLATGVVVLPAHHPVVMAKRLATIDRLSKGRLRLCIGLGWMREEIEACGADFDTRGRRTDESIDVMRTLWSDSGEEGATFSGEFFSFANAHSYPKPWERPGGKGIPIHIGGHSPGSVKRAARRGDGWHPLGLEGEALTSMLQALHEEAEAAGRDPREIEITLSSVASTSDAETLGKVREWGVTRLVMATGKRDLEAAKDELGSLADRVGLEPRR